MYAHQVIDDIGLFPKNNHHLNLMKYLIIDSHKFNLPDFDKIDVSNQAEDFASSPDLFDIRPPYDLCWFDYTSVTGDDVDESHQTKSSKRGVLTQLQDDWLSFVVFPFFDNVREWMIPVEVNAVNLRTKEWQSQKMQSISGRCQESCRLNHIHFPLTHPCFF
jgi:hypothetical protein